VESRPIRHANAIAATGVCSEAERREVAGTIEWIKLKSAGLGTVGKKTAATLRRALKVAAPQKTRC